MSLKKTVYDNEASNLVAAAIKSLVAAGGPELTGKPYVVRGEYAPAAGEMQTTYNALVAGYGRMLDDGVIDRPFYNAVIAMAEAGAIGYPLAQNALDKALVAAKLQKYGIGQLLGDVQAKYMAALSSAVKAEATRNQMLLAFAEVGAKLSGADAVYQAKAKIREFVGLYRSWQAQAADDKAKLSTSDYAALQKKTSPFISQLQPLIAAMAPALDWLGKEDSYFLGLGGLGAAVLAVPAGTIVLVLAAGALAVLGIYMLNNMLNARAAFYRERATELAAQEKNELAAEQKRYAAELAAAATPEAKAQAEAAHAGRLAALSDKYLVARSQFEAPPEWGKLALAGGALVALVALAPMLTSLIGRKK